jgi:hypothetical protein
MARTKASVLAQRDEAVRKYRQRKERARRIAEMMGEKGIHYRAKWYHLRSYIIVA